MGQAEPGMDTRASYLFEPDALLPVQWESVYGMSAAGPYQRLAIAVLMDALAVFDRPWRARDQAAEEADVVDWIAFRGLSGPRWPFEQVCQVAFPGRDPEIIRDGMLERIARQVAARDGREGEA